MQERYLLRGKKAVRLVVCWLGDDFEMSLPELIEREIRAIEWNKYAVDGNI